MFTLAFDCRRQTAVVVSLLVIVGALVGPTGPSAAASTEMTASTIVYAQEAAKGAWMHERHVWRMNVDTRVATGITTARYEQESPAWSPDGTRLAFSESGPVTDPRTGRTGRAVTHRIAVLDPANGSTAFLTPLAGPGAESLNDDLDAAWSPDGKSIAWTRRDATGGRGPRIWMMRSDGTGAHPLTDGRRSAFGPAWSPRGLLSFTRVRGATSAIPRDVWVMRPDGSHARRLISDASRAAWSPSGRRIAFGRPTARVRCGAGCRGTDLFVSNADGRDVTLLARNGGRPAWSPDGRRIVFQRVVGATSRTHLWIVNSDGTHLRQLTRGAGSEYAASWMPRGAAAARRATATPGRIAVDRPSQR